MSNRQKLPATGAGPGAPRSRRASEDSESVVAADALARPLLRPQEAFVPPNVIRTASFLLSRSVEFCLSRNEEARSCRDAAYKRSRDGQLGIPLYDELKSYFGSFLRSGLSYYFVAHYRGDRILDLGSVTEVLQADRPAKRLHRKELARLGIAYGLVNPFELWAPEMLDAPLMTCPVLQLFDEDLLEPVDLPATVMTNAGSLTWGVEFDPQQLVRRLEHVATERFSTVDPGGDAHWLGGQTRPPSSDHCEAVEDMRTRDAPSEAVVDE